MTEKQHSWFPASASPRGIPCPGSIKAAAELPPEESNNEHARLGEQCHEAMETAVILDDPIWDEELFDKPAIQIDLCNTAWAALQSLIDTHQPEHIDTEVTMDLGHLGRPDLGGTADLIMLLPDNKTAVLVDYKFGYNTVEPNNEQNYYYGVCLLGKYPELEQVILCIIQPKVRRDAVTHTVSRDELMAFATDTLLPAVEDAESENPTFNPGPVQCRFCPVAKHGCKYQTQQYLTAIEDFRPQQAYELDDEKLASLVTMVPAMQDAIKAVELAAVQRLKQGSAVLSQHFKLVERQTKRRWVDEEAALEWLRNRRFKLDEVTDRKLVSPAKVEKLIKGKNLRAATKEQFDELIEKPSGQLTYAPLSDRRKAVQVREMDAIEDAHLEDLF